jgi:O-succinylbenzoate synthase
MSAPRLLQLSWRPYRFALPRALITSRGAVLQRRGWLLRLQACDGRCGWGEAPEPLFAAGATGIAAAIRALPEAVNRTALELQLAQLPAPLACALGLALAELDGLGSAVLDGWMSAPPAAQLLPAGAAALAALDGHLAGAGAEPLTLKWKVAAADDALERRVLEQLLERLPATARLRLDANGGWDRRIAAGWADRLSAEPRLEWLEQPLPPQDMAGLEVLAQRIPVALDESLPYLSAEQRAAWPGWIVRRPAQEADPRPLLAQLRSGLPRQMLSTAFETGIARRLLEHLAALQAVGPTPTAPGLAPGWRPQGGLFAAEPEQVWEAAA